MAKFEHIRTGRISEVPDSQAHRYSTSRWRQLTGPSGVTARPTIEVPSGTVAEIIAWAGDDPYRIAAALDAELAGRQRKSLIAALS